MSGDGEKIQKINKTGDLSEDSGHEIDADAEDAKEKKFLDDAMQTVLDPTTQIIKAYDAVETFKLQLEELDKVNTTLELFMEGMDKLSLDVCKTSQEALWSYVTDINNDSKKNKMVRKRKQRHVNVNSLILTPKFCKQQLLTVTFCRKLCTQ